MLFASVELAERIECAERQLVADGARATMGRRGVEGMIREIGGGVVACVVDGSPLNKMAGLGFEWPIDAALLGEVEQEFASRGQSLQAEVSILARPEVSEMLTRRGYLLRGFENVLGCALTDGLDVRVEIDVALSPREERESWIDMMIDSFLVPDTQGVESHEVFDRDVLRQITSDLVADDAYACYVARVGGEPAGGASMRVTDGVAQLTGAATVPEHRRRGVQTALLRSRLIAAKERGADVAVVTTLPGSKSHQNVQRQGFELLYTRAILVKDPPADAP